jgi:hypothetical protein
MFMAMPFQRVQVQLPAVLPESALGVGVMGQVERFRERRPILAFPPDIFYNPLGLLGEFRPDLSQGGLESHVGLARHTLEQ